MADAYGISRRHMLLGGGAGVAAFLAGCGSSPGSDTGGGASSGTAAPAVPARRPSPNPYLAGNYAPVDAEISKRLLPIEGSIPSELRGTLLRNGPNPIAPDPAMYHWFSGDGMVHAIELGEGEAHYRNRWVRTDTAADLLHEEPIEGQPAEVRVPAAPRRASSPTPAKSLPFTKCRCRPRSTPRPAPSGATTSTGPCVLR